MFISLACICKPKKLTFVQAIKFTNITKKSKMQIPAHIIRKWKSYIEHGDISKIAEESGISRLTISEAFNQSKGTDTTVSAIQSFVDAKKQSLKPTK